MPVLNKDMKFVIENHNKEEQLTSLGYKIFSQDDEKYTIINQLDLVKLFPKLNSKASRIDYLCDSCHKNIFKLRPRTVSRKNFITCRSCSIKKTFSEHHDEIVSKMKETHLKNHNTEKLGQAPESIEKRKQTNLSRFGTEIPSQNNAIKEKIAKTNIERYGAANVFASELIKNKIKETNMERYHVPNPMQNEEMKKKNILAIKAANIKKYGTSSVLSLESTQLKSSQTRYKNNSCKTSKSQHYIHDVLGGKLNYPISSYNADIAFPDLRIVLEYDGKGHFIRFDQNKEKQREDKILSLGWKIIRFISKTNDITFPKSDLISLFSTCLNLLFSTQSDVLKIDLESHSISFQ